MHHDSVDRHSPLTRAAFDTSLSAWAASAEDLETVGDASQYGQTPWIYVIDDGHLYFLNADSTKEGVEEYLRVLLREPETSWTLVTNNRGRRNKAAFGSDARVIPKLYLYRSDET